MACPPCSTLGPASSRRHSLWSCQYVGRYLGGLNHGVTDCSLPFLVSARQIVHLVHLHEIRRRRFTCFQDSSGCVWRSHLLHHPAANLSTTGPRLPNSPSWPLGLEHSHPSPNRKVQYQQRAGQADQGTSTTTTLPDDSQWADYRTSPTSSPVYLITSNRGATRSCPHSSFLRLFSTGL
jgi:hypothetical protein